MNTTTAFKTIPVAGDGLRDGYRSHIIVTDDGIVATVDSIKKDGKGGHVIDWVQLACPVDVEPATGTIHLPDGATVDCVRVADWVAARDSEARHG